MIMDFIISKAKIENGGNAITYDKDALSGIKKIAAKISGDMEAVFGSAPQVHEEKASESPIYVGTVSDALIVGLGVDTSDIEGKREVYKITVVGESLVIVGSDKRGAIYGMFKLSEMLGVSPFIDWLDVLLGWILCFALELCKYSFRCAYLITLNLPFRWLVENYETTDNVIITCSFIMTLLSLLCLYGGIKVIKRLN